MSQLINLQVNAQMAQVTQNVVNLFESIKAHYVVNYSESLSSGKFGFRFGNLPIREHHISVGYKTPTASLRLNKIDWEFSKKILGKTPVQIFKEQECIRKAEGNDKANRYAQTLQGSVDAFFGPNIVTVEIGHETLTYCIDITCITEAVTSAVSTLLQQSNLLVKAEQSKTYRV